MEIKIGDYVKYSFTFKDRLIKQFFKIEQITNEGYILGPSNTFPIHLNSDIYKIVTIIPESKLIDLFYGGGKNHEF